MVQFCTFYKFKKLVSWNLTFLFSTNMAISETKGQGWRAIPTQWRNASDWEASRGSFKLLR